MTKKQQKWAIAAAILALLALLWWYFTRAKVAVESLTVLPDEQVGAPGASIPIADPQPWPWDHPETQAQVDAGQQLAAANPIAADPEVPVDYQAIIDQRTADIQAAIARTAAEQDAIMRSAVVY